MFLLSKLFAFVFLSPLLFVLLGLCGLGLHRKHPRTALAFFIGTISLFYLLSIAPIQQALLAPLEQRYPLNRKLLPKAQAYLVLGAGVLERTPAYSPFEKLPRTSLKRCAEAAYWYKKYPRPIIVCGGTPLRTGESEAACMAYALQALGVPTGQIFIEPFSRNTYENIHNAQNILRHKQWNKVLLVTSAMHMPRALHEAKKAGLKAMPLSCDQRLEKPLQLSWLSFLPDTYKLADSFSALKEYLGILYYRLRY